MEILGAQVPDVIAERFFCIFASVMSGQCVKMAAQVNDIVSTLGNQDASSQTPDKMDFMDLVQCYFTFKYKHSSEIG